MEMKSQQKHILWIDIVKCLCMVSVYLIHSQFYYGYGKVKYGNIVSPFVVNGFFFVSGYLFFMKKLASSTALQGRKEVFCKQVNNVLFRLVIPTLLFSSLIYIPKNIFHEGSLQWNDYFMEVFGGITFWFTSAMTIVQLFFAVLLLSGKKNICFYFTVSTLISTIAIYFNYQHPYAKASDYFPWYYKTGLAYTCLYALGGIYRKYETKIDSFIKKLLPLFAIIYVFAFVYWEELNAITLSLNGKMNIAGLAIMLVSITLVVALAKSFTPAPIITYIGRESIVLYFFSGVFPAFVGQIAKHFFPEPQYAITILVTITAFALGLFATWVIDKYLPFMTDLRKIKK